MSMLLGPEAEPASAAPGGPGHVPLETFVSRLETERRDSADCLRSWRSGEEVSLPSLGVLGEAVSHRRTLGEALRTLARGFPVLQSNSALSVEVDEDRAHISYRVLDPRIWPRRADAELTLGLIRSICGRYGVAREAVLGLSFEHEADRDLREMAQYLGRAPRFGQEENRITLAAGVLSNTRHDGAEDPRLGAIWWRAVESGMAELRRHSPVSHRVQELILRQIGRQPVNQQAVAAHLGLSERSLRRALAAEGRSFHDILEECRRIEGFALLVRSNRQFHEIAMLLGYSDQTAFSRAFSRWYGAPPRDIRKMGLAEESVIR